MKFWVSLNWRFSQFQVSIFEIEFLVYSFKGAYSSMYYFYPDDAILFILFYNLPLVKPTKLPGHVRTIWFFSMTPLFPFEALRLFPIILSWRWYISLPSNLRQTNRTLIMNVWSWYNIFTNISYISHIMLVWGQQVLYSLMYKRKHKLKINNLILSAEIKGTCPSFLFFHNFFLYPFHIYVNLFSG